MRELKVQDNRPSLQAGLARCLLAMAHPIRLRMLHLMATTCLAPEQFSQVLGVSQREISKHLNFFREAGIVLVHSNKNTKYYSIGGRPDEPASQMVSLALNLIEDDEVMNADVAVFNSIYRPPLNTHDAQDSAFPIGTENLSL